MKEVPDLGVDQLLERVIAVFERKGYIDTSIQDLVDATGWNRTSLYGIFGNKAGLFTAALQRYVRNRPLGALTLPPGASFPEALAIALAEIVNAVRDESRGRGCILFAAAGAIDRLDADLARTVSAAVAALEGRLTSRIAAAQAGGQIGYDGEPEAMARYLVATVLGLRATALRTGDKAHLAAVAETALRVLG